MGNAMGHRRGEDPAVGPQDPILLTEVYGHSRVQPSVISNGLFTPCKCFRLLADTKETPGSRISRPWTLRSDVAVFTGQQEQEETGRRGGGPTAGRVRQGPLEKALELSKHVRSNCPISSFPGLFGFIFFSPSAYRPLVSFSILP